MTGRRRFMLGCGCLGLLPWMGLLPRPARAGEASDWVMPAPFARPAAATDEGGLWALLDREEAKLRRSAFLIRDSGLQRYVTDIACRLAGEHCPNVRVYLVRTPFFNASMAPNGMMQVWSGLLLRMANEAQLAAVIAHEIGHYLARHSLERLRDARSRSAVGQFLGIALSAAGAGGAGAVGQLLLLAGMMAYSREQEREADRIGLLLMTRAGYPAIEASRVWRQLLDEAEAERALGGEGETRNILFASHPAADERHQALAELANGFPAGGDDGAARYRAAFMPLRRGLLEDELKRRKPGETLALLDRMQQQGPGDGELLYFKAEVFRMRNGDGDGERALAAYADAEKGENPPPEIFRGRGLVLRQAGQANEAAQAMARYLELKPTAEDAEMIKNYIGEMTR